MPNEEDSMIYEDRYLHRIKWKKDYLTKKITRNPQIFVWIGRLQLLNYLGCGCSTAVEHTPVEQNSWGFEFKSR